MGYRFGDDYWDYEPGELRLSPRERAVVAEFARERQEDELEPPLVVTAQ